MTPEEIHARVEELTTKLGVKVVGMTINKDGDEAVMFLKEPNREAKRAIMDKMMTSPTAAGQLYLEATLIKDQSDPRISSSSPEHDAIVLGAEVACIPLIEIYQAEIKKK